MRLGFHKTKFKSEAHNRVWNGPEDSLDKKSFKIPFREGLKSVACQAQSLFMMMKKQNFNRRQWGSAMDTRGWRRKICLFGNFQIFWQSPRFIFKLLVGIVSAGSAADCANLNIPGLYQYLFFLWYLIMSLAFYTKVKHYLTWIKKHASDGACGLSLTKR